METLVLQKRNAQTRRYSREYHKQRIIDPEDALISISHSLLFRSAFGKMHLSHSSEETSDYGAVRSKKHLKCSR